MTRLVNLRFVALLVALSLAACGAAEEGHAAEPTPASTGGEPSPELAEATDTTEPGAPGACSTDDDCREVDDYCGGCNCITLGPGEEAPTCSEPVACFASPCRVTPGRPACVEHRCVRAPSEAASQ